MPGAIDVDVLRAHLADFPDLGRFSAVLSDGERDRARAYLIAEPRDVFTLARGLLRLELARRMNVEPGAVHFDVRPSGKPDVRPGAASRPDWRFSVSHTGPHVAIAFALGADVGLDIERLDRAVEPLAIAKRYFTLRELRALEAVPVGERARSFVAGWTRKEAIVKARGGTMAESLATLSVDLDPAQTRPGHQDEREAGTRPRCRLTSFELPDRKLMGAVALVGELPPRLRFHVVSNSRFD